jgi:alpha-amylase/alpha-mannosidase (GH57 family)
VQTNDYDRTVIGLSAWEKTILKDLEKLFGYTQRIEVKELIETITDQEVIEETEVYNPKTKKIELVTSTTTEPVSTFEERVSYINDQITFGNSVRKNIELRTAQGKSGKEYLVYGFPERNTLVIAGSIDVFLRIVDRLKIKE